MGARSDFGYASIKSYCSIVCVCGGCGCASGMHTGGEYSDARDDCEGASAMNAVGDYDGSTDECQW